MQNTDLKEGVTPKTKGEIWIWKMTYCRKNRLPPAQSWAWTRADKAYTEHLEKQVNNDAAIKKSST
jgi:hypothetical protein